MNQLTAQYQQSILHNNDTGMSNIVLYIPGILLGGNWGDTSIYFTSSLTYIKTSENLRGEEHHPICERRAFLL